MAAYEYAFHSNLNGLDRDFFRGDLTARGGRDFRVVQCNPGNIVVGGVSHAIPAGGVTTATRGQLVPGTTNRCDNAQYQDLLPEQERHSFVSTFDQEIGDRFKIFADGFWTRREFVNQVGNQAAALTVRNVNPYFVAPPGSTATSVTVNYSFGDQLPSNDTADSRRRIRRLWERAQTSLAAGISKARTATAAIPSGVPRNMESTMRR
jgi:iron complex outermembrane receptor protein